MNPLLDLSGLPRFADFKPEHVTPAMNALLADNRAQIECLAAIAVPTWVNFVAPLWNANEKLNRAWSQVSHMNAVMNSPELREVYNANLPRITQYYTELGQNPALYERFRQLAASPQYAALDRAQRKVIDNEVRDFRLGGAELGVDDKARFMRISEELSELSSRFSDNLLDATNAYGEYVSDEKTLIGLPPDALQAAHEAAKIEGNAGWKFTLHAPSYMPVLQYAEDRDLRARMYRAYTTRASELGANPEWDNTVLIGRIVTLRRELAQLVGYAGYAEYSLATKMADTPVQVLDFLQDLAARARPFAERDVAELKAFAHESLGLEDVQSWDIAYVSEKLRIARYAFSEQEIKRYFPETTVVPGMFRLVETLYGVSIAPAQAPTWDSSVHFYAIRDGKGELIGQFYLDLYARPSKRGGAWMDDAITRRRLDRGIQIPVAYLNCNFSPPLAGKPALFTHDELITLFHEFGHGLHHLLTRVEELGVSGINGVEWDAVELPSQFMENFCWEWGVLHGMSSHCETGTTLPRVLFDKMIAARNFQSGLHMLRQVEFALFDMRLHYGFDPEKESFARVLDAVRRQVAVITPPDFNRFAHSFSHIFGGGYAAGYYSYQWAEVLSADAYSLFEEHGVLDSATGGRFRDEILAVGGSRPALESFIAFRGRAPTADALLRHSGMTGAAA